MPDSLKGFLKHVLKGIAVTAGVVICFISIPITIFIVSASTPPKPVSNITVNGVNYVLTCKELIQGGIDLTLYQCKDKFDDTCKIVEYGTGGTACNEDMTLVKRNGIIDFKNSKSSSFLMLAIPSPTP